MVCRVFAAGFVAAVLLHALPAGAGAGPGHALVSPFNGRTLTVSGEVPRVPYTFLVGGHLYGSPRNRASVLPAATALAAIERINAQDAACFIGAGDLFRRSDPLDMQRFVDVFAGRLDAPFFNAPGNHDLSERRAYEERFGPTYFRFDLHGDIFLVLDTELDGGTIDGEQLDLFAGAATDAASSPGNLFIFSHKLLWSAEPRYDVVRRHQNTTLGYPAPENFATKVRPLLEKSAGGRSVYWFSGDIGVAESLPLFHHADETLGVTFVATGIGDTPRDAIVRIDVDGGGSATLTALPLDGAAPEPLNRFGPGYWRDHFANDPGPVATDLPQPSRVVRLIRSRKFWVGVVLGFALGAGLVAAWWRVL